VAGGTEIEAPGLPRLITTLDAAGKDIQDMGAAGEDAGQIIAGGARSRVPVVTGYLRSTIGASVSGNTVTIGADARYAAVVHGGSAARNMRAQPFLTDAVAETERAWTEAYVSEMDRIIDKVEAD
jgi:HK97 gp10 family phage protein